MLGCAAVVGAPKLQPATKLVNRNAVGAGVGILAVFAIGAGSGRAGDTLQLPHEDKLAPVILR
jgi:hypothetical protein